MSAGRPLRVLCVDDSADDADLNVLALGRAGYSIESRRVDREDQAREALSKPAWDVVLCDYSMPNFSAPAMLALLAERDVEIPCLIVSGAIGEEAAAEAIRLGAYDYIFKNNLKRLGPAVDRALRDADLRRARVLMEQQLRASETRLRLLFEQLPALVVTTDTDLTITSIEGARLAALGMDSEALLNTRIATSALLADESRFPVRRAHLKALQGVAGEYEMIWGGKTLQGHVEPLRTESGRIIGTISVAFDITERKVAEQRLTYFSQFDLLTDLPNRTVLEDRLAQALVVAARHGDELAVFAIDLDRFKEMNETYGRAGGDELLRSVGRRLRRLCDDTSTVSRFGEDLFVILALDLPGHDAVEAQARRLRDAFEAPFEVRGSEVYITASFGIACFREDGTDAHGLVEAAEAALLSAKQSGRNTWRFFAPSMLLSSVERLALKRDLRVAASNEQLALHYQPILRASDGAIAGLEVLVRWNHPELGLLMPDNFVPLAEESGAIEDVGEWVLGAACDQYMKWAREGIHFGRISVNLSARQFEGRDLRQRVADIIERTGIPPDQLELELTESAIMRDVTGAIATLQDLKRLGVRIAVDDFGAGYTSLSFLRRFPVDSLKIDQSFVRDL
ncbi:MAG TPA: EAL domain-containing protein, partial [Candidatus Dormibacteraeota bacterium]|nr:EAL domain-containing protein [Candidatus Dormibacteraeota bacterium]